MFEHEQTFENLNKYIQASNQDVQSQDTPEQKRLKDDQRASLDQSPNFYDPNKRRSIDGHGGIKDHKSRSRSSDGEYDSVSRR